MMMLSQQVARGFSSSTRTLTTIGKTVTCYLDLKSPHAFLAIAPTLTLERDYVCKVNWKPFELSYVDLGVSTRESLSDMVRVAPSAAGDRRARMYYAAAREYARLQGLSMRGPARLLNSRKANMTMLLAEREGLAMQFARAVFMAGWPNGFRDYDLTDLARITETLAAVGASSRLLGELPAFVEVGGPGEDEYSRVQAVAIDDGVVGVPHYVIEHSGKRKGLFGREHLALIRGWLHEEGLARREDVKPDLSHAWRG